ncbi:iron ABC transporter permease [candidate division KSB1 bacterium]|nr:iron ABC transporter permease [candidate division KSB1 bacterium]
MISLRKYDLTPVRLIFLLGLLGLLAVFLVYPLLYVIKGAFWVEDRPTFMFIWFMISDPAQWSIVLNSINLGVITTLATTLVSIPLAMVMVRYDFRGKEIMNGLLLVPMILPPFVGAVGMRQMFARFGSINLLLMDAGIIQQPIDWFGQGDLIGVIVLQVLHLYPIMYLNVAAALANVDPAMEEAARNVGASGFTLFRKITFPLMLPGYFAGASIVFIWSFTDLGTPLVFEYRRLIAVQIFDLVTDIHGNPMGYVLVMFMMLLGIAFFSLSKSSMRGRRYEMLVHGQVGRTAKRASIVTSLLIYGSFFGLTLLALIPHISVVLTSLTERWFMSVLPETFTLKYYSLVFEHHLTSIAIRNSFMLSSLSTVVDIFAGITIAYLLARTRIPGKSIIDTLTMLPLAIPGIIIAFGFVAGFSGTFLDARQNPVPLLVCAYAIRRLPYMVRSAYAGFQQINVSLEEAAQNVGATPATTLRKITLPLIFANLVAGAILCFSFAMLEVSDSLILAIEENDYPITKALYMLLGRPDGTYIASALGVLGMFLLMASLVLAGKFLGRRMGELFRA